MRWVFLVRRLSTPSFQPKHENRECYSCLGATFPSPTTQTPSVLQMQTTLGPVIAKSQSLSLGFASTITPGASSCKINTLQVPTGHRCGYLVTVTHHPDNLAQHHYHHQHSAHDATPRTVTEGRMRHVGNSGEARRLVG